MRVLPGVAFLACLSIGAPALADTPNVEVVDRFISLVKKGDYRKAEGLLSPSFVWVNQKFPEGRKSLASSYTIYLALSDIEVGVLESANCQKVDDTEVSCLFKRNSLFGDGGFDLTERYFVSDGKIAKVVNTIPPEILKLGAQGGNK